MDGFANRILGIESEDTPLLARLHVELSDDTVGEAENTKVTTACHADAADLSVEVLRDLHLHFGNRVIRRAPKLRLCLDDISCLLVRCMASKHIRPFLLSVLAESEVGNRARV